MTYFEGRLAPKKDRWKPKEEKEKGKGITISKKKRSKNLEMDPPRLKQEVDAGHITS